MRNTQKGSREATTIDVLAAVAARIAPKMLTNTIDQARHDAHRVIAFWRGRAGVPAWNTREALPPAPPPLESVSLRAALPGFLRGQREAKQSAKTAPTLTLVKDAPTLGISPRMMRVREVIQETAEAVSIVLQTADGGPIAYAPGQFVTVLVPVDAGKEPLRRAYSINRARCEEGTISITVKRVDRGVVSTYLNERCTFDDELGVLGPSGSFTLPEALPSQLVFVAGGSGITPVRAMIESALETNDSVRVLLVYGNRDRSAIIFHDALTALMQEHPERFTITSVLELPHEGFEATIGRLDRVALEASLVQHAVGDDASYFLCGPEGMMAEAHAALTARGVEKGRVKEERFSSPSKRASETVSIPGGQRVTLKIDGQQREVIARAGQTVLEAGLAAGLNMPHSCTLGGCGACKVKLVSGSVEMIEPNCLTDDERAAGEILACVSCARTDLTVQVVR